MTVSLSSGVPPTADDVPEVLHPKHWPVPKGYSNGMMAGGRVLVTGGIVGWNEAGVFPDGFVAQDLGSKNGTWLNGAPLAAPTRLADGDELSVAARYTLYFVDSEATAPLLFEGRGLRVDTESRTVYVNGEPLDPALSVPQFELLLALYESAGQVVGRDVPSLAVRVDLRDSILSKTTAPNTIGILVGADPKLRDEYVVFSAHMDHIGITPGQRDSINNGADDDGSGTTGVVELAEAFSRPGVRPARSILFITVSGEEKGLWGSRYFSEHPTVPLDRIVADLNIDMIGRNWRDTIVAIGKEHSDLGATLERVNAAHPELHMTAIDDRWPEERFYFRSDHYNFARKGVPILFFFNGTHPDYHEVTDSPDKIDGEKESRILRLLFYLGQEVANAPKRPEWNPGSKAEIVE